MSERSLYMCEKAEVGAAFATAKQKRAREREEKKRGKAKEPSAEGKKYESALFPPFAAPHWKSGARARRHRQGGKARDLW